MESLRFNDNDVGLTNNWYVEIVIKIKKNQIFLGIFAPGDGGSIFSAPPLTKVLQALDQQCSFQSYSTLYNDTGLFGVVFTTFRPEITPQIIDVIQSEIRRIAFDLSDGKFFYFEIFLTKYSR